MTAPSRDQTRTSLPGQELRASDRSHLLDGGLRRETIEGAWLRFVNRREGAEVLKRLRPSPHLAGILFTHFGIDGGILGYSVRSDRPRILKRNKLMKYVAERGVTPPPYFPRFVPPHLWTDAATPIIVTEGAKKSLSVAQLGYVCVGLAGVDLAHDVEARRATKRWVLSEFLRPVILPGRFVFIAFDSDVTQKRDVARAESRLATMVSAAGAKPFIVRVPAGHRGQKQGIDDYLAPLSDENRLVGLRLLLDAAYPWTPPPPKSPPRPRYKQKVLAAGLSAHGQFVTMKFLMEQTGLSRAAVNRHLEVLMQADRPRVRRVGRGKYLFGGPTTRRSGR